MKTITTIDLWTEQYPNQYECFNGGFVDGFENNQMPFDRYKIIKNCNCLITSNNKNVNIRNKHNAIVFYKKNVPVRLMVINKETDIEKCINIALEQLFSNEELKDQYQKLNIQSCSVDLKRKPMDKIDDKTREIDVGSCDRWCLLYNMLKGSYTESDTSYGNYENDKYEFMPNISIKYELETDTEIFEIDHHCAFINILKTRIIPIQENSLLTK